MSRRSSTSGCMEFLKTNGSYKETLVVALAELLGSAILVFVGCTGCIGSLIGPAPQFQIALTFGFAIATIIHLIGHISRSHINPLVSVCLAILGVESVATAAIYISSHFVGAILGYGVLKIITPRDLLHNGDERTLGSFCVTKLNPQVLPFHGMLVESLATAILIFFVCGCADPRNRGRPDTKEIKFGLLIAMLVMACGPFTGCSMNPARSFAPALLNNDWKNHWVYWVGPISGAVASSVAYKLVFWPKQQSAKVELPEGAPLKGVTVDNEKSEH